jgi:hypothetical protein
MRYIITQNIILALLKFRQKYGIDELPVALHCYEWDEDALKWMI